MLHRLTYILILHPIGGAIALISFLFGLCGIAFASRACTIIMAATSFLAALTALFVFVIDMVLWNLVKQRLHDAGYEASLVRIQLLASLTVQGIANWFTVGAVVALWLAFCTSICGAFGRFASGRAAGEKVSGFTSLESVWLTTSVLNERLRLLGEEEKIICGLSAATS